MLIGALARATGTAPRMLRYYEQRGLLQPTRIRSNYRDYDLSDVDKVRTIRALLTTGLPTATIRLLLPCISVKEDKLIPTCPEMRQHLLRERDRVAYDLSVLDRAGAGIDQLLQQLPST